MDLSREITVAAFALALAMPAVGACQRGPGALAPPVAAQSGAAESPAIRDEDLVASIDHVMAEDRLLRGQQVQVAVTQGVASLDGSVPTLSARERAGKLAGTIRGVRSVVDRITVQAPLRSDEAIQSDVLQALHDGLATKAQVIGVAVKSGGVTLSGATDSWQERTLLGELTAAVPGVRKVDDQVAVHYQLTRPAAEIAGEVRERIDDDVWLDGATITVTAAGQTVKLAGAVASFGQKLRAEYDAWVDGVASVDGGDMRVDCRARDAQRRVTESPLRTDDEVIRAIGTAFKYDPRLGGAAPALSMHDGTLVLSGTVESANARRAAEQDAEDTVGVWGVRDELRLASTPPPTDADVDRGVARALAADAFLPDHASIRVSTSQGTVTLIGAVASGPERHDAEIDARTVPGVTELDDRLTVYLAQPVVQRAIEDRLFSDARVERDRIAVAVAPDGVTTLSGTVRSWAEAKAAIDDARRGGANRVVDLLKLEGHPEFVGR